MQAPAQRLRRDLSLGKNFGAGLYDRAPRMQRSASADAEGESAARRPSVQGGAPAYMQPRKRGYRAEKARARVDAPAPLPSAPLLGAMDGPATRRSERSARGATPVKTEDVEALKARVAQKAQALQKLGPRRATCRRHLVKCWARCPLRRRKPPPTRRGFPKCSGRSAQLQSAGAASGESGVRTHPFSAGWRVFSVSRARLA